MPDTPAPDTRASDLGRPTAAEATAARERIPTHPQLASPESLGNLLAQTEDGRADMAANTPAGIGDPHEPAGVPCTQCKGGRVQTIRAHATCDNCDHCLSCEDGEGPHPGVFGESGLERADGSTRVGDRCPRYVCVSEESVLGLYGDHLTCGACGWCQTCLDRTCCVSCDWCGGDPPVKALALGWPHSGDYCEDCESMVVAASEEVLGPRPGTPAADLAILDTYPDVLVLTDQDDRPVYVRAIAIQVLTRSRADGLTVVHLTGGGSDWCTVREAPLYILQLAGWRALASRVAHEATQGAPAPEAPAMSPQGEG